MLKYTFILFLALYGPVLMFSQENRPEIYNPEVNAIIQLDSAILQAKNENKHILIQVGGNWCKWCILLHKFIESQPQLDSLISTDYVLVRINYSKENKNPETMERLGFPQRFGFPVLLILDTSGNRIHTQDTAYLEDGEGYSYEKIKSFLEKWNVKAVSKETYNQNKLP